MRIPRRIHKIWLEQQPPPVKISDYQASWPSLNPGWSWKLWTEDSLPPLINHPSNDSKTLSHLQLSRFHKYNILEQEGGIYVDADCACTQPIETLVSDCEAFFIRERENPTSHRPLSSSIMGCTPHHPIFQNLLKNLRSLKPKELPTFDSWYLLNHLIQQSQLHDDRKIKMISTEIWSYHAHTLHNNRHQVITLNNASQLLSTYLDLPSERLSSFLNEDAIGGYLGAGDWPKSCIREPEGKLLYAITRSLKPETILEFGTNLGCSTSHFNAALEANQSGRIITVDTDQSRRKITSPQIKPVQQDGITYSTSIDFPLDLIFHDGPHLEQFTFQILKNCLPRLKPGGLILAHDACHPEFGSDVREGMTRALGSNFICLTIPPSECGLGCWRKPT